MCVCLCVDVIASTEFQLEELTANLVNRGPLDSHSMMPFKKKPMLEHAQYRSLTKRKNTKTDDTRRSEIG